MKIINIEKIKRILRKGKMVLVPIAISCAIVSTGCSECENKLVENAKENGYSIIEVDNSLYDNFNKMYMIEASNVDHLVYSKICTVAEFGKYTNESNITWNDIKNTINNNSSIDDNLKNIIIDGVNKLEANNINCKLELLNYNLKNLKIEYNDEVLCDEALNVQGLFDAYNQVVHINKNLSNNSEFKKVILHEILGHGMTMGYIDIDGGVFCSPAISMLVNDENSSIEDSHIFELGSILKEAEAEMISVLASGIKTDSSNNEYYAIYVQTLQMILTTTNTDFNSLLDNGLLYLLDRMKKSGCENPVDYIFKYDVKKSYYETNIDFCTNIGLINDMQIKYLNEIIETMKNENMSNEQMVEIIDKSISSSEKYIIPEKFDEVNGLMWVNDCYIELINYDYIRNNTIGLLDNTKIKTLKNNLQL